MRLTSALNARLARLAGLKAEHALADGEIALRFLKRTVSAGLRTVMQIAETIGFQVRLLRQCFLDKLSPLIRHAPQKANNGGLFAPDLMTGFAASVAILLSLRPILSKPVDSRF